MSKSNSNSTQKQHGNCELLPCPFCGEKAKAEKEFLGHWKIKCTKCSCDVGRYWFLTKQHAIEAWNTRTPKERGGEK